MKTRIIFTVAVLLVLVSGIAMATQPWTVELRNRAGRALPAGSIVVANQTTDDAFAIAPASGRKVLGVLVANCTNNTVCPVAVSGPAWVLVNGTMTRSNSCFMGPAPGQANCSSPALPANRNATIGEAISNKTGKKAKILLHLRSN